MKAKPAAAVGANWEIVVPDPLFILGFSGRFLGAVPANLPAGPGMPIFR
jgi:hypothetical protein